MATSTDQIFNFYYNNGATPEEAQVYTAYYLPQLVTGKIKKGKTPELLTSVQIYEQEAPTYTDYLTRAYSGDVLWGSIYQQIFDGADELVIKSYLDTDDNAFNYMSNLGLTSDDLMPVVKDILKEKQKADKKIGDQNLKLEKFALDNGLPSPSVKYAWKPDQAYEAGEIEYAGITDQYNNFMKKVEADLRKTGKYNEDQIQKALDAQRKIFRTQVNDQIAKKPTPFLDAAMKKWGMR